MARLIFALLCEGAVANEDSSIDIFNAFALIQTVPAKIIRRPPEDNQQKPLFSIVTSWLRSEIFAPETAKIRLRMKNPEGKPLLQDSFGELHLTERQHIVIITQVMGLPPLSSAGLYEVEVHISQSGKWKKLYSCPLYVDLIKEDPEPSEAEDAPVAE